MTMMIIINNDSDNDNDIIGSGVKRLMCTGEASGRSPSQYVDVIYLEFLPGQDVIFIVLIVIPADPPCPPWTGPVLAAMCDVKAPVYLRVSSDTRHLMCHMSPLTSSHIQHQRSILRPPQDYHMY